MDSTQELTLLSEEEIWGKTFGAKRLNVLKKYGTKFAMTDLAFLRGGDRSSVYTAPDDDSLKGRTGWHYTRSNSTETFRSVMCIDADGTKSTQSRNERRSIILPAIQSSAIFDSISLNRIEGYNGTEEVEYGEYPQYAPSFDVQQLLEQEFKKGCLPKTGKNYTFDATDLFDNSQCFQPITFDEYEYKGKKFIRVEAQTHYDDYFILSNGERYMNGDNVWVEVSPIRWLVDDKTKTLLSKKGILSGIRFDSIHGEIDFKYTEIYNFLNKYLAKDIIPSKAHPLLLDPPKEEPEIEEQKKEVEKKRNPYGLNLGLVSEEDIIKGSIESGVAVFLHGASSEGKSARVKQIDPDCVIIYLRNATPESLNGKSVYNSKKGEMIDIKPSWLKKLEAKCAAEPNKLHIVFFDEITNALPSIQGIAFNIVLEREVNGIWKLPENARIVAAGNEMKDSLSANQLAEPLFNRFAHVYIKTTTEQWLKWASEHNIHPAIYSYIAYKKGKTLRSIYDGEKPNADPRKWEMASKMLYTTGRPEMLRALVGYDITKEFVEFCNEPVITLDDVLNGNYSEYDIQSLNTASRYATTMGLSQVDEENMEKVRSFVTSLGAEFGALFDSLWAHGDESRLELIAETRMANFRR